MIEPSPGASAEPAARAEFWRGAVAILPLWLGIVPFAVAFAVLARTDDFSSFETIALSLFVFAGSAQLAFIRLAGDGAGWLSILLTVLVLNARHVLYGLSLDRRLPPRTKPPRAWLAYVLTDEAYGFSMREFARGTGTAAFFFGAGSSLFACFTSATILGALFGGFIPDPKKLGLEFVFPLCFLALLLPLLKTRVDFTVAALGAALALIVSRFTSGGATILAATIGAALAGSILSRPKPEPV